MNIVNNNERSIKIIEGLRKAYEKMIELKRQNKSEIVVLKNNKVVRIRP
jgi:hypothetical protein